MNKATWDWILNEKVAPPERQIMWLLDPKEMMGRPYTIEEAVAETTSWHGSSGDNDRALSSRGDVGKNLYFNMKDAMKARDLDLDVVDSYEGYIY